MDKLHVQVAESIRHFWKTRQEQALRQGSRTGQRDTGARSDVTGGRQFDGFITLCKKFLVEAGLPEPNVFWRSQREIPGYFRPQKEWDLLAVVDGELVAVVEFKSQVGPSFGNNYNNRTEESLGNATDLWAAYREGAFKSSQAHFLLMRLPLRKPAKLSEAVLNSQSRQRFDDLVDEVLEALPPMVHELIEKVPLHVEDYPSADVMRRTGVRHRRQLCGLFTGIPLTDRSVQHSGTLPDMVTIYREGIMAAATNPFGRVRTDRLKEEIRITILHELAHFHGLDEDELEALGYG